MGEYLGLATRILESARSRKDVQVLYAPPAQLPGTPTGELDTIEKKLGAPLPPEVRDFYLGASHLWLVWQEGEPGRRASTEPHKWSDVCDTDSTYWTENLRPWRDYSRRGGMICILKAGEVFRKGYWIDRIVPEPDGSEITLDGQTMKDSALYENLYPFDFLTTYYVVGLWRNPESGKWRVVLGGSHGACWDDYPTLSVPEYFDQLEKGLGGAHVFGEKEVWPLRAEE